MTKETIFVVLSFKLFSWLYVKYWTLSIYECSLILKVTMYLLIWEYILLYLNLKIFPDQSYLQWQQNICGPTHKVWKTAGSAKFWKIHEGNFKRFLLFTLFFFPPFYIASPKFYFPVELVRSQPGKFYLQGCQSTLRLAVGNPPTKTEEKHWKII